MILNNHQVNYAINIGIHVVILFTFLTLFFFLYVSKLTKKEVQEAFNTMIDKKVDEMLSELNNVDNISINWNELNTMANKISINSVKELPEIEENNKKLENIGKIIIISLLLGIFCVYIFGIFSGYNIPIIYIILENILIFSLIGIVEYIFFTKIASKYVPTTPEFISITILDRIKFKMTEKILKEKQE